jgi:hypothetical protein
MRARSRFDLALGGYLAVIVALFVPKVVWAETALYREVIDEPVLLHVGALTKIAGLCAGAVFAARCARSFGPRTPSRFGWWLVTVWLAAWLGAQCVLGHYQMVLGIGAPFPSPADVLFMIGYPFMILSFFVFIHAYAVTGLVGSSRSHFLVGGVGTIVFGVLGWLVLEPVVAAGGETIELVLNVAYPAFDLLALLPTLVLARITVNLVGGALFWVWALVVVAIGFMVAGDILYGYFSMLGYGTLDPLLDVLYIAAYVLVARGVYQQHRISVAT